MLILRKVIAIALILSLGLPDGLVPAVPAAYSPGYSPLFSSEALTPSAREVLHPILIRSSLNQRMQESSLARKGLTPAQSVGVGLAIIAGMVWLLNAARFNPAYALAALPLITTIPQKPFVALAATPITPYLVGKTAIKNVQAAQIATALKALALAKAGRLPETEGEQIVIGEDDESLVLTAQKYGRGIEWSFARDPEVAARAIALSKIEGVRLQSHNAPSLLNRITEVPVTEVGFRRWGIPGRKAKLLLALLGTPPNEPVKRTIQLSDGRHFEIFTRRQDSLTVWAFRWADREVVGAYAGFVPPTAHPIESPSTQRFADYVRAELRQGPLSGPAEAIPAIFHIKAGRLGELILGEYEGRAIRLARTAFGKGDSITVTKHPWDPDHPNVGVYFHLQSDKTAMDIMASPDGEFLESVPTTGSEVLEMYIRDRIAGRDLARSTLMAMRKSYSTFSAQPKFKSVFRFREVYGRLPSLYLQGVPVDGNVTFHFIQNQLGNPSAGVHLEAIYKTQRWTILIEPEGTILRTRLRSQGDDATAVSENAALAIRENRTFVARGTQNRVQMTSETGETSFVPLRGMSPDSLVHFEPIRASEDSFGLPYYRVVAKEVLAIGIPLLEAPYIDFIEDGALVMYRGTLWVKEGIEDASHQLQRTMGYKLSHGFVVDVSVKLLGAHDVRRASAEEIIHHTRVSDPLVDVDRRTSESLDRLSRGGPPRSERFLRRRIQRYIEQHRIFQFGVYGRSFTVQDAQESRDHAFGRMIHRWLTTTFSIRTQKKMYVFGRALQKYAALLLKDPELRIAIVANGGIRELNLTGVEVFFLRRSKKSEIPDHILSIFIAAAKALSLSMGLRITFVVKEEPVLSSSGELNWLAPAVAKLFKPVLFAETTLMESARGQAITASATFTEDIALRWLSIQAAVWRVRKNKDVLPSLDQMREIYPSEGEAKAMDEPPEGLNTLSAAMLFLPGDSVPPILSRVLLAIGIGLSIYLAGRIAQTFLRARRVRDMALEAAA